jgi:hypothetical protein
MSQENLDLLRRGVDHVVRTGELSPDTVQPDLVWDTTTFSSAGLNLRRCVGLAETNRWLAEWAGAFDDWSLDIEEVFDGGDQVVTFVRQRARASRAAQSWRCASHRSGHSAMGL